MIHTVYTVYSRVMIDRKQRFAERLAMLRTLWPGWEITRAPGKHTIGWVAARGDERLWAPYLAALEVLLADAENRAEA